MVWVYKEDGTRQCGTGTEIALDEMREELAKLIGGGNILNQEKRILPLIFPMVCGGRNGHVNAYEITEDGARTLFTGIVGKNEFELWRWGGEKLASGPEVPFPLSEAIKAASNDEEAAAIIQHLLASLAGAGQNPTNISELIGRTCRYYKTGDSLTYDLRPNRVNIEVNNRREIVRIWFG